MKNKGYFFILGAIDPEMSIIQSLLLEKGYEWSVALDHDGRRVHPGNANRSVGVGGWLPAGSKVVFIECRVEGIEPDVVIDHHAPGDDGYGVEPERYLDGSSLGQLVKLLYPRHNGVAYFDYSSRPVAVVEVVNGVEVRREAISELVLFAAAADHCIGAAYRGRCPGIDPEELGRWRAKWRAEFQKRSVEEVLADVEATTRALEQAPVVFFGDRWFRDMRREEVYPELPEAGLRAGISYLSGPLKDRDQRVKYCASGIKSEIEAFLAHAGEQLGLVDIYGDPERGYAGGYLPQ